MSDNDNKKEEKLDQTNWKYKVNDLLSTCQSEIKKTTQIGMKMITASQSTGKLNEIYESLGRKIKNSIESGEISIDDNEVLSLIAKAKQLEVDLEGLESDVQDIKKS